MTSSKLAPVERMPLLAVRFTTKASRRLQELVEERLKEAGFDVLNHVVTGNQAVLTLTADQHILEHQAELSHLMKKTHDTKLVEKFSEKERDRFCDTNEPYRDQFGLFTSGERTLLISLMINNIPLLPSNVDETELFVTLNTEYQPMEIEGSQVFDNVTKSERRGLLEHGPRSEGLKQILLSYDLVDAFMLVHPPMKVKKDIIRQTCFPFSRLNPPVAMIQSYYGCEVGFYFAWMGFLTQWYFFPAALGLALFILRQMRNESVNEDAYIPFYGIVGFFWGILFLKFWDRYEHRLAYNWGTYSLSKYERSKFFAVRSEFKGYLRYSPVTGQPETYYPASYRRLKYVAGAMVTSIMLAAAFTVMILSLNLQGYIRPSSNPRRWDDNNPHPFHFPALAELSLEGRLFDSTSSWRCLIPVVIHVIGINLLNTAYRLVAEALTKWENHETHVNHRSSLILKRFLFEAFDCYVALFYLAFYERNVERLRMELLAVFQIDTIRRLAMECIIPLLLFNFRKSQIHYNQPPSGSITHSDIPSMSEILNDLVKDEYEQFEDYLEIIIQLGYVTLFASAYPLASLVSIAANWVEIRSDCYRMTMLCQRPTAYRTQGMQMWRDLMAGIIWLSALTNCLLIGFSSEQLMQYIPDFYIHDKGYTDMGHEKSWIVVFIVFGLERALLVVGLFLQKIIPDVPEDIENLLEKAHYEHMRSESLARSVPGLRKQKQYTQSQEQEKSISYSFDYPQLGIQEEASPSAKKTN